MFSQIPQLSEDLTQEHIEFLSNMSTSCRRSIVKMITKASSGHSGGSMSMTDFLTLIYALRLSQTGEKIVISNGHTSPSVYAILAEMGYADKDDVLENFRAFGKVYEGHVNRHMPGIFYGTGPLGCGFSAGVGFALAEKLDKSNNNKVFVTVGDGEMNEGQVYEAAMFANKEKLDNLIVFVDFNKVQLMGSLEEILPMDIKSIYSAIGWKIIDVDGHNFQSMWEGLREAENTQGKPILLLGHTVMGKGITFMEEVGSELDSAWHGRPTKDHEMEHALDELKLPENYESELSEYKKLIQWTPSEPIFEENLKPLPDVQTGTPRLYDGEKDVAPRTAYGQALLDISKLNPKLYGMSGDVGVSVRTDLIQNENPEQFIEFGICEQNMVTVAGAMSLAGYHVFTSAYGPFMTSRPKDQVRLNDINHTNVKMVATHSGLSVGEDGPTHQSIDDMGANIGHFNTNVMEAVDANHMDRVIRYIASHYGNFYVRTGRHDAPIVKKKDGTPFYDENYKIEPGKADVIREGDEVTLLASGPMVDYACQVADKMDGKVEVIAISWIKDIDRETVLRSLKKTGALITIEDHNPLNGLASQVSLMLAQEGVGVPYAPMGVREYQLSGKYHLLYEAAGLGVNDIEKNIQKLLEKKSVKETTQKGAYV